MPDAPTTSYVGAKKPKKVVLSSKGKIKAAAAKSKAKGRKK